MKGINSAFKIKSDLNLDTDCVKIYQLPQKPELIKVVAPYLLREWPIAFADWDMNTAEEVRLNSIAFS